ncbi:hypothetical protein [Nostoc sp.]|uniref:hypothetical protein n=1 Tax=Nostoc sp. TaxID=1180 RepID=UPI002FFA4AC2
MELNGKQPEANPEKNTPSTEPPHWTNTRRKIHSWLDEEAPSLAELYESAVCLMFEIHIPSRVKLVSHCVRDICNRLVVVQVGNKSGGRLDYVNRIDQLTKIWHGKGFSRDGIFTEFGINFQASLHYSSANISIPHDVFSEIDNLIKDHIETSSQIDERVMFFFVECVPENKFSQNSLFPLVKQWKNIKDWFVSKAHDNGTVDADYDDQSLLYNFELFEQVLSTLAQSFFSTTDEIDDILEEANSSTA